MAKDAIAILLDDHQGAKEAFQKIQDAEAGEKEELFEELANALKAHVQLEKELFYPRIIQKIGTDEIRTFIEGQREEETEGTGMLEELVELGVDDPGFDEKFRSFRDTVLKHAVQQEEQGLFPIVRKRMTNRDLEDLGREMAERKRTLQREMAPSPTR
jgi:iron-sulfur cluster repair protein YtfE (RIC family)